MTSKVRLLCGVWLGAGAIVVPTWAQPAPASSGPYDVSALAGGDGFAQPLPGRPQGSTVPVGTAWTLSAWVQPAATGGTVIVGGVGDGAPGGHGIYLALSGVTPAFLNGGGQPLSGGGHLAEGRWTFLAAVSDGSTVRLFLNGEEVAHGPAPAGDVPAQVVVSPRDPAAGPNAGFAGKVAGLTFTPAATSATALRSQAAHQPDSLTVFTDAAATWPVQTRQMMGQVTPQDAWTRPRPRGDYGKPTAKPVPNLPALAAEAPGRWTVNGWRLASATDVRQIGSAVAQPGYDAKGWYAATVPGTVLQTLVDRGVYADPTIGLNNLLIPESLHEHDWWYRTEVAPPATLAGKHLFLVFKGVNYQAQVWVNGRAVGSMKGAFIRGRFDVTGLLVPGRANAIAVRVSPPLHPGVAQEESLTSGVGENGGMQMLDGPTFVASEGWDWIPTVRDRDTGLWQGVALEAVGDVAIGDPQVVTTLPNGSTEADVEVDVPVSNLTDRAVTASVSAGFDGVSVSKPVQLAPHASATVTMAPAEFAELKVPNPKLWWPNGYGDPALHTLHVTAAADGQPADAKDVRFGMRQVTYELSLFDRAGALKRVEIDLAKARTLHQQIVDYRHEAIRKVPGQWAASLMPGAEASPAVTPVTGEDGLTPYLVIKVNGVRIAARGGAWGTDDWMKRVSREKLEPYFQLHRDAHVNVIRNWVGQNTEDVFYDLADEYGMMIVNDFWESTQNYNIEAEDVPLFEANAADVIAHDRNHPSIVVWFGRNEGVPQPILNQGLEHLVNTLDGTRLYLGSSNTINLHDSGPYNWRPPEEYFTTDSKGFAVEVGTPSFPTLESWKRAIPSPADQWPVSDSWAYHDWHQTGNGAVKSFTDAMDREFGTPTSLPDFEKKAQMLEYESYRAIFEGMNAELWTKNSGRMLWMTHPAWPSSAWQSYSSDYDTHGAFYGMKKASEPVHVQMNLPDHKVILVNNERAAHPGMSVRAQVFALDGSRLDDKMTTLDVGAGSIADAFTLSLPLATHPVVFVALTATDAGGRVLSRNTYWQGRDDASLQALNSMGQASVGARAGQPHREGGDVVVPVTLGTAGRSPIAIETKLTLFNADGSQVLPAFFEDNYLTLMPGESRTVSVRYPATAAHGRVTLALRGYNVRPTRLALPPPH